MDNQTKERATDTTNFYSLLTNSEIREISLKALHDDKEVALLTLRELSQLYDYIGCHVRQHEVRDEITRASSVLLELRTRLLKKQLYACKRKT